MGWEVERTVTHFPSAFPPPKNQNQILFNFYLFERVGALTPEFTDAHISQTNLSVCRFVRRLTLFLAKSYAIGSGANIYFPSFFASPLALRMAAHTRIAGHSPCLFFLGNRLMCLPPCFLKGGGGNTWGPRENEDNSTVKYGCIPT